MPERGEKENRIDSNWRKRGIKKQDTKKGKGAEGRLKPIHVCP